MIRADAQSSSRLFPAAARGGGPRRRQHPHIHDLRTRKRGRSSPSGQTPGSASTSARVSRWARFSRSQALSAPPPPSAATSQGSPVHSFRRETSRPARSRGAPGAGSKVMAPGRKLIGRTNRSTSSLRPISRLASIRARTSSNDCGLARAGAAGAEGWGCAQGAGRSRRHRSMSRRAWGRLEAARLRAAPSAPLPDQGDLRRSRDGLAPSPPPPSGLARGAPRRGPSAAASARARDRFPRRGRRADRRQPGGLVLGQGQGVGTKRLGHRRSRGRGPRGQASPPPDRRRSRRGCGRPRSPRPRAAVHGQLEQADGLGPVGQLQHVAHHPRR